MPLSQETKENLIGPLVVGACFGFLFAGIDVWFIFKEEGGSVYLAIAFGTFAFLAVGGSCFSLFGIVPALLRKLLIRHHHEDV